MRKVTHEGIEAICLCALYGTYIFREEFTKVQKNAEMQNSYPGSLYIIN